MTKQELVERMGQAQAWLPGKRVKIDSLRVVEEGHGAEMEVTVEDTTPGGAPVVASGTRANTSVLLRVVLCLVRS